jgi:hypothetical protein
MLDVLLTGIVETPSLFTEIYTLGNTQVFTVKQFYVNFIKNYTQ